MFIFFSIFHSFKNARHKFMVRLIHIFNYSTLKTTNFIKAKGFFVIPFHAKLHV